MSQGLTGTTGATGAIVLSGDVTGSGTSSITTAIGSGVIVNADVNASAAIDTSKLNYSVTTKTGNYTAASESVILCDATSASFTITLPSVATVGRHYNIKKIDSTANTVTLDGNASETIDGATTLVLGAQYQSVTIVSDGSAWWVI